VTLVQTSLSRFITARMARCQAERGYTTASCLSICLSFCDFEVQWSHRLEQFKNNFDATVCKDFQRDFVHIFYNFVTVVFSYPKGLMV